MITWKLENIPMCQGISWDRDKVLETFFNIWAKERLNILYAERYVLTLPSKYITVNY